MSIIGAVTSKNQSSPVIPEANVIQLILKISDLPAGTYIASGRLQRATQGTSTSVTAWVLIAAEAETVEVSYLHGTTLPGGVSYSGANAVRIITLREPGSICLYVRTTDATVGFAGAMQVVRIA